MDSARAGVAVLQYLVDNVRRRGISGEVEMQEINKTKSEFSLNQNAMSLGW
jgi:hypothetical protein